jgi:coenzyme F420-reducing hydrogenase beta subunit
MGTFCGIPAMLTGEAFATYLTKRGINLHQITRVSNECVSLIQGLRSYRVHFNGEYQDFPVIRLLGELNAQRLRCDDACFDYSSELADVSVGGKIPPELLLRHLSNVVFVRTKSGVELVRIAQKSRLLHTSRLSRLGLRGLRLFPPFRRKRNRYLKSHSNTTQSHE